MRYLIAFLLGVAIGLGLTVTTDTLKHFTFPAEAAPPSSRVDRSGDPMLHYPQRMMLMDPAMPAFMKPERPRVRYVRKLPTIIRPETILTARQGYGRRDVPVATPAATEMTSAKDNDF